jgi:hypothetical protein
VKLSFSSAPRLLAVCLPCATLAVEQYAAADPPNMAQIPECQALRGDQRGSPKYAKDERACIVKMQQIQRAASQHLAPPPPSPTRTLPSPGMLAPTPAPAPPGWLSELPTVDTVRSTIRGSDADDTTARQDAAFAALRDYLDVTGHHSPALPAMSDPSWQTAWNASSRYNQYEGAQTAQPPKNGAVGRGLSPAASRYFEDSHARIGVLAKFLSPSSLAPYQRTQAALAEGQAARQHNADLSVFGLQLGQPLNLPKCGEGTVQSLFAGALTGVARGGQETCVGERTAETALAFIRLFDKLAGTQPPSDGTDEVSVGLADAKCPMWLKTSATCTIAARTSGGVLVGASVAAGVDSDALRKVPEELARKYGPADPQGHPIECTNDVTKRVVASDGTWADVPVGTQRHTGTALSWSRLPGLYVSYVPFAVPGSCRAGRVEIDLASYHQAAATAAARVEASEPKM